MKDALFFNTMLTPKIILLVYWLGLLGVIASGLYTLLSGSFIIGLLSIVGGVIGVRIWCELLIVMFKIHENLKRIADKQD